MERRIVPPVDGGGPGTGRRPLRRRPCAGLPRPPDPTPPPLRGAAEAVPAGDGGLLGQRDGRPAVLRRQRGGRPGPDPGSRTGHPAAPAARRARPAGCADAGRRPPPAPFHAGVRPRGLQPGPDATGEGPAGGLPGLPQIPRRGLGRGRVPNPAGHARQRSDGRHEAGRARHPPEQRAVGAGVPQAHRARPPDRHPRHRLPHRRGPAGGGHVRPQAVRKTSSSTPAKTTGWTGWPTIRPRRFPRPSRSSTPPTAAWTGRCGRPPGSSAACSPSSAR